MYSSTGGQQGHRDQRRGNALALWLVVALVLLAIGVVAVLLGRSANEQRLDAVEETTALKLVEIRNRMTWIHHDLLTDGLIADLDGTEIDDARLTLFEAQRATAVDELHEIADGDTDWSDTAADLLDIYNQPDYMMRPYLAFDLEDQHYLSVSPSEAPNLVSDWPEHEVASVWAMLPRLVLVDALSVALVQRDSGPSEWSADFAIETYDILKDAPGWLGPERQAPLVDNVVSSPSASRLGQSPGAETSAVLSELRSVWDYDQWFVLSAEDSFSSQPPLSIEQVTLAANATVAALRNDATTAVEDDVDRIEGETPGQFVVLAWYLLGIGSIISAFIMVGGLLYRLLGRHRTLAEDALTDPLTGARNRRYLDTEVVDRCGEGSDHHLVVMVDLDRFKLVNDTWGHDIGDALLRTLTARLHGAAANLTDGRAGASASIVRTGGDEFVIVFHGSEQLDADEVEQRIRELTGPLNLEQDDAISLEFSLGIAQARGPVDLAGLLKAADLAAYEDKKHRATDRQAAFERAEAPVTIEIP